MKLKIADIVADPDVQPRKWGLHWPTVDEYVERIEAGDQFPDPVVYHDGKKHWLSEGFHRVAAFKKRGDTEIDVVVRRGGKEDATVNAAASNRQHGLKMSNEDKRTAVAKVLFHRPGWSDRKIADHVGVGHPLVAKLRGGSTGIDSSSTEPPRREGIDGKVRSHKHIAPKSPPSQPVPVPPPPAPKPKPVLELPPLKPPHVSANPLSWSGRLEEAVRAIEEAENIVGYALIWPTADGLVRQAGDLKWARSPDEADRGSQVCPETLRLKAYLRSLAALLAKRFNRAA